MDYHLYYHDDFDGMASGAVMLNFLRGQGDDIVSFNPIDYAPKLNENWVKYKFKKPFILVDFRYHPKADWWFDHHNTSFNKPALASWKKGYKNDATHYCDPKPKSCCSLVLIHLQKFCHYQPIQYIKNLARWSDKIDGYAYKSAREAIESRVSALKLASYVSYEKNKKNRIKLLKSLATSSINKIILDKEIARKIKLCLANTRKKIRNLPKISIFYRNVVWVDASKSTMDVPHFLVYAVYPKFKYSVVLEKIGDFYHLGVGFNRWQEDKSRNNLGTLMSKYGGGGHKTVGAVEKKSKKEIFKIAQEIVEYLNKHG